MTNTMTAADYKYARLSLGLSRASLARESGDRVETIAGRERGDIAIDENAAYDIYRLLKNPPPRDAKTPIGAAAIRRTTGSFSNLQ